MSRATNETDYPEELSEPMPLHTVRAEVDPLRFLVLALLGVGCAYLVAQVLFWLAGQLRAFV